MAETPEERKARKAREAEVKRKKLQKRQEEKAARRIRNLGKQMGATPGDKRRKNDQRGRHRE